jgi:hypothetical protein
MSEVASRSARPRRVTHGRQMVRRIVKTITFGMVRGMATAAGGAIVTGAIWLVSHH